MVTLVSRARAITRCARMRVRGLENANLEMYSWNAMFLFYAIPSIGYKTIHRSPEICFGNVENDFPVDLKRRDGGRLPPIYKFTMVILNEKRWSTSRTPHLVGTWLVEIFMHLGLNQVHGLILGLIFQVGGFGLSGTRVMSSNWTRVTDQILDLLPPDVSPFYYT
jgi:hypothetical protein